MLPSALPVGCAEYRNGDLSLPAVAKNGLRGFHLGRCGEAFDGARHEARSAVKAVTYHNLEIRRGEGGYEVDIVFDV